jgi:hypothetical protein
VQRVFGDWARGEVPASFEAKGAPAIDPRLSAELAAYVGATR